MTGRLSTRPKRSRFSCPRRSAAAMFVPALLRLPRGLPRALGVATWIAGLIVAVAATGGSLENAIGALIPGGILVAAGTAIPVERLRGGTRRGEAVTLRSPMERQSAA